MSGVIVRLDFKKKHLRGVFKYAWEEEYRKEFHREPDMIDLSKFDGPDFSFAVQLETIGEFQLAFDFISEMSEGTDLFEFKAYTRQVQTLPTVNT
jgi:hypothetical protein